MKRIRFITTAPLLLALGLLGCSGSGDTTAEPAGDAGGSSADLSVAETDLGEIVVDGNGMTIYIFDMDTAGSGESTCSGQCLSNWPPVTVDSGQPEVDGVTGEVDTITATNGETQLTLDGWPLYLYVADAGAGDVTGQAVEDVWWVVSPGGDKITSADSSGSGGYSR